MIGHECGIYSTIQSRHDEVGGGAVGRGTQTLVTAGRIRIRIGTDGGTKARSTVGPKRVGGEHAWDYGVRGMTDG